MHIIGILIALVVIGWLVASQVGGKTQSGAAKDATGYTAPLKTYQNVKGKMQDIEDQTNKARQDAIDQLDQNE